VALALMPLQEDDAEDAAASPVVVEMVPAATATPVDSPDVAHGPLMEEAMLTPQAAKETKARQSKEWEAAAVAGLKGGSVRAAPFDPETTKAGVVSPMHSPKEDSEDRPHQLPANANSIFDPNRLDKMAAGKNPHDESVQASGDSRKKAEADRKSWVNDLPKPPEGFVDMSSGRIMRAGGADRDVLMYKAPSNQISMLDDIKGKSKEELQKALADMFASRIPDTRKEIRDAQEKRREEIQGKKEAGADKSWEKVSKNTSTSEIANRLLKIWTGKKKEAEKKDGQPL
jgi:hypothetical protein